MKKIYLYIGIGGWLVLLLFIIAGITISDPPKNQIDEVRRTFQMHEVVTHPVSNDDSIAVKVTHGNIILDSMTPQICKFGDCVDDRKPGKHVLTVMLDITNLANDEYYDSPFQFDIEDANGKRYSLTDSDFRFSALEVSKGETYQTQIVYDVNAPSSQYKLILKQSWSDIETAISLDKLETLRPELCTGDADCFTGFVDKVVDGGTVDILDIESGKVRQIRLSLADTPKVGETNYDNAKDFTTGFCPVESYVLFDEDDSQADDSGDVQTGELFCEGLSIHENLLKHELAVIDTRFCETSEYAHESWAKNNGCN